MFQFLRYLYFFRAGFKCFLRGMMLSALMGCFAISAFSQSVVNGTVTSADDGNPLPGVTVLLKNSTTGTTTDNDGNYRLTVNDGNGVLVFSFIGFKTEEVSIGSQSVINLSMAADITALGEVVVIGYGEVKRSNVTGSIVSVKSEDLVRVPSTNVMEALQGNVPGMDITRTSGSAGGSVNIRVRGTRSLLANSEPLFIVDGVQYSSIQDLNPNDIQSMEVLKDAASTAIYGSRGANGVILITTKKGTSGKTKVNFNTYAGVSSINGYPEVQNATEYANQRREAQRAAGNWSGPEDDATIFSEAELAQLQAGGTDWRDLLIQDGTQQDYQVGLSSGNEKTNLYASLDYFKEKGILSDDELDRYTVRLNVDHALSKVFKIGLQNQFTYYDHDKRRDPFNISNKLSPIERVYDDAGNPIPIVNNGKTVNPLMDQRDNNYANSVITSRYFTSAYLEYKPVEFLTLRSVLGVTRTSIRDGLFAGALSVERNNTPALTKVTDSTGMSLNLENIVTFNKTFGDHSLTVTGVQSVLRNTGERLLSSGTNQLLSNQGPFGLGNANSAVATSFVYGESALLSYTGRIQYGLKDKYLLTLVGRSDGASQLSKGRKWAFFPSISAAWRIIEESFMENADVMTDLKLRASYGIAGTSAVDPYSTQSVLSRVPWAWDERFSAGYGISNRLGNDALGWETSATVNVGLDFGMLNNRVTGSLDIFKTQTKDLLLPRLLPTTSGYERTIQNIGETETSGVEIGVNTIAIDKGDLTWRIGASWFTTREKITALATGDRDIANRWFVGEPTQAWFDYEKVGIWQTDQADAATTFGQVPGQIRVVDQNGDDILDQANDRKILGSPRPDWIANLTSDLRFKNFDLSVQVFARWGQMIRYDFANIYDPTANENSIRHDYWTPENPSNEYPRPNASTSKSAVPYLSSLLYKDGSFAKLRGITLGYTVPSSILAKTPLTSIRIYVTGKNLATMSKIADYDPERGGGETTPLTKLIVGGLNIGF